MTLTVPEDSPNSEETLMDVPVLADLASLGDHLDRDSLRFSLMGETLAFELEPSGALAWIKVPTLTPGDVWDLQALTGPGCPSAPPADPKDVWSHDYVAVFHFDAYVDATNAFVDSVEGIELAVDTDSAQTQDPGHLGAFVRKAGDDALLAADPVLDLSGPTSLSTLAWVRLAPGQDGVLEWDEQSARHREVVAKLSGYRLSAVWGETGPVSTLPQAPFFNIVQVAGDPEQNDSITGADAVPEDQWTMLAGTYDTETNGLFTNGVLAASGEAVHEPGSNRAGNIRVGRYLRGGIDEVRISSTARSPGWIRIQYLSMARGLVDVGTPELVQP